MRVISLVREHAEELSEFLDKHAVSYRRTQGKWADLFEWDRPVNVGIPGLQPIPIAVDIV